MEKKTHFLSETNLKVIAGILTVIGGSLSFLGQHPKGYWIFVALAVIVLAWILVPQLFSIAERIARLRSDKRYVAREYPRLRRFYERFIPFTEQNDGRSFRYMLYNASTSQNSVVTSIIAFDYIPSWIRCYGIHLEIAPRSVSEFLRTCNEFTIIVAAFNQYYVIKTQQGLEKTPFQPDHFTAQFEQFREEFAHYLRELEDWVNSVYAEVKKRAPNLLQFPQTLPVSIFERAKSFRGKSAAVQQ